MMEEMKAKGIKAKKDEEVCTTHETAGTNRPTMGG